jgi:hypothetical protein
MAWHGIPQPFGLSEELHQPVQVFGSQLLGWRYITEHYTQPGRERRRDSIIQLHNNNMPRLLQELHDSCKGWAVAWADVVSRT